jgi:hypothetical protein
MLFILDFGHKKSTSCLVLDWESCKKDYFFFFAAPFSAFAAS